MNSFQYDSQLSATIPISDYNAFDKAREAVRQDNFEDFLTYVEPWYKEEENLGFPVGGGDFADIDF